MLEERLEERVVGVARLDHHLTALAATAGATRHLREHRIKTLAGAIVGGEQCRVGVQHGDKGELREVMALGEQLRADQDVAFAAPQSLEGAHERIAPAGAVAVDAPDACAGEEPREGLFPPPGAAGPPPWGGTGPGGGGGPQTPPPAPA